MGIASWLRRAGLSGLSSPPPEPSPAGCAAGRPASSSDRFDLSPARGAAGVRPGRIVRRLWRGLAAGLLALPLLAALATGVHAQSGISIDVQVTDAYEGENIDLTITLSRAPGNIAEGFRTFIVATDPPTAGDVTSCINNGRGCPSGSTPAAASDFTDTDTNVVFGPTDTVKTLSIPTATDSVNEGTEVVEIQMEVNGQANHPYVNAGDYTGRIGFRNENNDVLVFPTYILMHTYGLIRNSSRPAPAKPTGVSLTATGNSGEVTLSWDDPGDDMITGWQIRFKAGSGSYSVWGNLAGSTATTTSWTFMNLADGTEHAFQLRARSRDTFGLPSEEVKATPFVDTGAPSVSSVVRQTPSASPTDADSLTWRVTFDEAVSNVSSADFTVSGTTATVTGVSAHGSSGAVYDVTVSGGNLANLDGTVTLGFASGNDIADAQGNLLGASPSVVGADERAWVVLNTLRVLSVERRFASPAFGVRNLAWYVTFSEAVRNVGTADFTVTGTTATVSAVVPLSTTRYQVFTGVGDLRTLEGTVTLGFASGQDIEDTDGNRLSDTTSFGTPDERSYVLDRPPGVSSIARQSPSASPADADELTWRVTFDEAVSNVDAADFEVSGTTATVTGVTEHGTGGTTWDVTVSGGDLAGLDGTVTLGFASGHDIEDSAGIALPASPAVSGANESYVMENTATVSFTAGRYEVSERDGKVVVTLVLSRARASGLQVLISATPLTATGSGVDYFGQTFRPVFEPGATSAEFEIQLRDDNVAEGRETFRLDIHTHTLPAGVTAGTHLLAHVGINDPYKLRIDVADAYEGGEIEVTLSVDPAPGRAPASARSFIVAADAPTASEVSACVRHHGCEADTAPAAAGDFTAVAKAVTFAPAELEKKVRIPVGRDYTDEGPEAVRIDVTYVPGASVPGRAGPGMFDGLTANDVQGRRSFFSGPSISPSVVSVNTYGMILSPATQPPRVLSIGRRTPSDRLSSPSALTWRVTFDEAVRNVDAGDFAAFGTSAPVTSVTKVAGKMKNAYDVTVSGGDLAVIDRTVTLLFVTAQDIEDLDGNALEATEPADGVPYAYAVGRLRTVSLVGNSHIPLTEDEQHPHGGALFRALSLKLDPADPVREKINLLACVKDTGTAVFRTAAGDDPPDFDLYHTGSPRGGLMPVDGDNCVFTGIGVGEIQNAEFVLLQPVPDARFEPDETVVVELRRFPGGVVNGVREAPTPPHVVFDAATRTSVFTIANDDPGPGLEFDTAHLRWNEADGCGSGSFRNELWTVDGDHGPSYRVRLDMRPPGDVRVVVYDPNDLEYPSVRGPTMRRVAVENNDPAARARVLTFTPLNWDAWQTVKVRVACTYHYTPPVPIVNRIPGDYVLRRGRWGFDNNGNRVQRDVWVREIGRIWTVEVDVLESNPPIEVKDLPVRGEAVTVADGGTRDFRIRVNESLLPAGSGGSVTIHLASTGPVRVARRDGRAQSTSAYYSDYMRFTDSTREQWVRLSDSGCGGRDCDHEEGMLEITIRGMEDVWKMTWPITVGQGQGDEVPGAGTAPTDPVSGLVVTAADDTTANAAWDAVAHATSYSVSWEAVNADSSVSLNGDGRVTGTTAVIRHDATEPMTLTVTVTPEYVDGNGELQRVDGLAATADLAVGPGAVGGRDDAENDAQKEAQKEAARAACVAPEARKNAEAGLSGTGNAAHAKLLYRSLIAFGGDLPAYPTKWGAAPTAPATLAEVKAGRGPWSGWDPVEKALECLEDLEKAQPEHTPTPVPEITVSGGGGVTEGTAASFTVTATPPPSSPLQVTLGITRAGDFAAAGETGSRTVTVPVSGSVGVDIPTVNDAVDEADGSVTATANPGTGYTVKAGAGSASVAVRDDDEPVISVSAGAAVTEGAAASFTVTADPVPHAPLEVALTVSQDGDFAAAGGTGAKTVTVPTTGSVTLEVPTVNDEKDEPDGSVTATVDAGAGYAVAAAPANAASVEVRDDDAATGLPALSVGDATGSESDRQVRFTVRLSRAVDRHLWVYARTRDSTPVSAEGGRDYVPVRNRVVRFRPGETEHTVRVYVVDDSHDEDPETFELVLANVYVVGPRQGGVVIGDGVAVGTIVNDDPMPAAWLSRFGRTAAEQALDGIAGRMAAARTPGLDATLAGQALGGGDAAAETAGMTPTERRTARAERDAQLAMAELARTIAGERHGDGMDGGAPGLAGDPHGRSLAGDSRTMTAKEAMLGTSFSLTGARDGAGGTLAFWGRASQSQFDGREGTFSLDGEATAAMLGADYARGRWLAGLALMQTGGKGGYADTGSGPQSCPEGTDPEMAHLCNGAVREGDGKVEASLTAAVPYGAWQASERLKLWGALGYGTGEVTLKPNMGGSYKADIAWTMAAAGLRGELIAPPAEGSGPALAVTSDALWARTSSDKTHDLAASESDVTRLRLGLEGSWHVALEGGGTVAPKLEVGARHDGGDAETGFGVELGGGIAWNDPVLGLSLDLSGRTLIAHEDGDLKDRGYSASVSWDPAPETERGPSISMRQAFGGEARGGLDALFRTDPLADRTGSEATSRWEAEAAWGLPVFGGRWTGSPHAGLGLSEGHRDYSLGWRLTPEARSAPDLSFGLKAERRESVTAKPEHAVGIELTTRW